jgi:hypothetical protein
VPDPPGAPGFVGLGVRGRARLSRVALDGGGLLTRDGAGAPAAALDDSAAAGATPPQTTRHRFLPRDEEERPQLS